MEHCRYGKERKCSSQWDYKQKRENLSDYHDHRIQCCPHTKKKQTGKLGFIQWTGTKEGTMTNS